MFDPSVPIYTVLVLSNLTAGINDGPFVCGPLYITVDSNEYINLNWDFNCSSHMFPQLIKLYILCGKNKICEDGLEPRDIDRGSFRTQVKLSPSMENFPAGWDRESPYADAGSYCLPLVIESSTDEQVVDRRCLRIYPSWMQNYGNVRIGELLIPGTHNSGSWTGTTNLIRNYVYNQDRDLYQQLVFGQRYFDIRVGIVEDSFHITHNIIPTSKLDEELENIARFAEKSPKEIIIVDVHKFNLPIYAGRKEQAGTLALFQEKLGKYIIPNSYSGGHMYGPKLSELWETGRNVIIAYFSREIVESLPFLWPAVKRSWGDKIDENELLKYILSEAQKNEPGNPMKVLMGELTPNAKFIMKNPTKSLGYLADIINDNLTYWLSDNYIGDKFNIIATDFFLGNRLVEYSIEVNNEKIW